MNMKISFINRMVLHLTVQAYLNDNLPRRGIGHASGEDNMMLKWPPCLPDLIPSDYIFWGYVKTLVYVLSSSCKCKRAQTKNQYRTGNSYQRHAASCLGGARLLT